MSSEAASSLFRGLGDWVDRRIRKPELLAEPITPADDREFTELYGAYWHDPRRTLLTPFLAGAALSLHRLDPGHFPYDCSAHVELFTLLDEEDGELRPFFRGGMVQLTSPACALLREHVPEADAVAALGLALAMPLRERMAVLVRSLPGMELPAPWVALHLEAALALGKGQALALLRGEAPFQKVALRLAELAERQGISSWEQAFLASRSYWADARGQAWLRAVAERARAARVPRPAAAPASLRVVAGSGGERRRLEGELAQVTRQLAEARAEAEARLARLAAAQREAAEARQARDRAAERVRVLEAENADLRVELPTLRELVRRSRRLEDAERLAETVAAVEPTGLAPAPAPSFWEVFVGRRIYLYTGRPRAGAREAMRRALERHGATCEVFDGNRVGNLGPERFPADALVVIDTSQLAHTASLLVEARARASGAWVFLGATGVGGLARRVAERWWRARGVTGAGPAQ